MFNRPNAPHTPGRPQGADNRPRHKFYAILSSMVARVNPQRSVELRVLSCQGWIPVGNVTIPVSQPMPEVGWVVAIRYLGASRESKSLDQPTYLGRREDVEVHECLLSQVRFEAEAKEG